MRTIALVLATLVWIGAAAASPTGLDLYVLAGQSNISGRDVGFAVPPRYSSDPAVLGSWVYNDSWHQGRLRSDSPDGETRALVDDDSEVGFSLSITLTIGRNASSGKAIGIVTCARGGTSAHEWRAAGPLFGTCIARVKEALPGNNLKGLVWYQGEADSNEGLADIVRFYQRTIDILAAFRTSLDAPDLPIVIVGLGDNITTGDAAYAWQTIQMLQQAINLPYTAFVSAAGLPRMEDGGHLSGPAHLALGSMVSNAFESIR